MTQKKFDSILIVVSSLIILYVFFSMINYIHRHPDDKSTIETKPITLFLDAILWRR